MPDSVKEYPNILDYSFHIYNSVKFVADDSNFSFNYYFLNFLLWYLEYDFENEKYINKIPFKENSKTERIYNAALFYLEFFCHYEDIIQGAKFDYKYYPYSSFKEWDFDEIDERLDQQINTWFHSLNYSFQQFKVNEFNDEEELKNISTSINPFYKSCYDKLVPLVKDLNYEWMTEKDVLNTFLNEEDKSILRDYAPILRILNHTQHSDFQINQKSFKMKFERKFNNNDYSSLNKFIRFFDIKNIHGHFQRICTSYLKFGLINDMKDQLHFENIYKPSTYSVSGPTDAIKRFSKLIIDEYNVYSKDDLARKIYFLCNVFDDNNDMQVLNMDSLVRIMHRYEPEILISNNCKK